MKCLNKEGINSHVKKFLFYSGTIFSLSSFQIGRIKSSIHKTKETLFALFPRGNNYIKNFLLNSSEFLSTKVE